MKTLKFRAAWLLCWVLSAQMAVAASLPSGALSATDLLDAVKGKEIGHRGILRSGKEATMFADGYIEAVADAEMRSGRWCSKTAVLPGEIVERVASYIENYPNDARQFAADQAVAEALQRHLPCVRR